MNFCFFFSSVAVGANSFYRRIYANPDSNTIETVNFDIHRPSKSLAILLLYLRARLIPVTIAMLPTLPRELSIDDLAHPMDIPIYHYTHICVCVYIYISLTCNEREYLHDSFAKALATRETITEVRKIFNNREFEILLVLFIRCI